MQGLDQEMPSDKFMSPTAIQARLGKDITTAAVDESVLRMLTPMFSVGVMDAHFADPTTWSYHKLSRNVTTEASVKSARKLSALCTVLLKNTGQLLPLSPHKKVAVIGFGSDNAVVHAGGSGSVVPSSVVSPLQGVNAVLSSPATYSDGTDLEEAVGMAAAADVAIVFVATLSHEGGDRASLSLDDGCTPDTRPGHTGVGHPCMGNNNQQNAMVSAIAKANPNTVVVMSVPGAVLTPWADEVPAILTNFMPGQAAGDARAHARTHTLAGWARRGCCWEISDHCPLTALLLRADALLTAWHGLLCTGHWNACRGRHLRYTLRQGQPFRTPPRHLSQL